MEVKLYVGNLAYSTTESALEQLFNQSGEVESVSLVTDRNTGKSKGFAFVTMATSDGAQKAIEKLHDYALAGRQLTVKIADQPKEPAAYQSKLGAFSITGRSPKVSNLNTRKSGGGYQSKLGAFGEGGRGPTQPRRRGGNQRH